MYHSESSTIFFSKPPVKNFFSTNSSRPNSSRPTPHSRTLCASSCDLTELSSVDHSLHNCHPKRRRKTTTAVCLAHKLCSSTIWWEIIVSSHDNLKALKELQRKNNKESVWTVILNWWILGRWCHLGSSRYQRLKYWS